MEPKLSTVVTRGLLFPPGFLRALVQWGVVTRGRGPRPVRDGRRLRHRCRTASQGTAPVPCDAGMARGGPQAAARMPGQISTTAAAGALWAAGTSTVTDSRWWVSG